VKGTYYSDYLYWNTGTNDWTVGSEQVHLGRGAGLFNQGPYSVAIGYHAGRNSQSFQSVSIGREAGITNQAQLAVAVGNAAGQTSQGSNSVAIGNLAGSTSQGEISVAIGAQSGETSQASSAVSVGFLSGTSNQGRLAVAIGAQSGQFSQKEGATALGFNAGGFNQGVAAVALGLNAGSEFQGTGAVAIGLSAGQTSQGSNAIAIGYQAGFSNQHDNSTVLNATNVVLNTDQANALFIKPIRQQQPDDPSLLNLKYNVSTGEIVSVTAKTGEYTPTVAILSTPNGGSIDQVNEAHYSENGKFVTINGNFVMTYPTAGTDFTVLIPPPAEFPIVEGLGASKSGSILALGGNQGPLCQSVIWESNDGGDPNPNTFQILFRSESPFGAEDTNQINYTITYRKEV
jgi:hypothetical protein